MAQTKEETEGIMNAKSSKTWRILRLSLKNKLSAFEKIDDGKNVGLLVEAPQAAGGPSKTQAEGENDIGGPDRGSTNVVGQSATVEEQAPEGSKKLEASDAKQAEAT